MQTKTQSIVTEIISALLLILFLYTAVSKLIDHERFEMVLKKSPLLQEVAEPVSWLVPLSELVVSLSLFVPAWRLYGFRLAFGLMSIFTLYIGYMILFTPHLPCSCGGVIRKMSWSQHLIFNIFFTGLAWSGMRLEKKKLVIAITQA
ncbi:MAG: hypothetical protein DI535_02635 [Citrobacter freundii]|nr:MAG: hypothetical protein DI535_02635 [Citrobacter freundii]